MLHLVDINAEVAGNVPHASHLCGEYGRMRVFDVMSV